MGKTVKEKDSTEIYSAGGWTWIVLRHYQKPEKEKANQYSRVFCVVYSPYAPTGDMGDVYTCDIPGYKYA